MEVGFSCPWYRPLASPGDEIKTLNRGIRYESGMYEDPRSVGGRLLMTSILKTVCAVALKARFLARKKASHDAVYLDQMSSKSVVIAN